MSEELHPQEQAIEEEDELHIGCSICGNSDIEDSYQLALCTNCREKLIKRPLPVWVKGIFVLMAILFIVAITRFPSTFKAGIAFERGMRAEASGKYLTAMKEYKVVTDRFPNSTLSLARLFISTYNNGSVSEAYEIFKKIAGRNPKDQSIVTEVNGTIDRIEKMYFTSDELGKILNEHQNDKSDQLVTLLKKFLSNNPGDVQASYYLSDILFDQKKYDEAELIMSKIIETNPDFYEGYLFMAAIYRQKGDFEKAQESCKVVIEHNSENSSAYASLAKVLLKSHEDDKGLEMAKKAYEINQNDPSVLATLSLAYHYNNLTKERDDMFNQLKKQYKDDTYDLNFLNGIFSNKEKWRD